MVFMPVSLVTPRWTYTDIGRLTICERWLILHKAGGTWAVALHPISLSVGLVEFLNVGRKHRPRSSCGPVLDIYLSRLVKFPLEKHLVLHHRHWRGKHHIGSGIRRRPCVLSAIHEQQNRRASGVPAPSIPTYTRRTYVKLICYTIIANPPPLHYHTRWACQKERNHSHTQ